MEEGHNFPILGPQGLTDPKEAIHVGEDTNSPAWNLKAWPFLWRTAREEGTLIPQHGTSGPGWVGWVSCNGGCTTFKVWHSRDW